MCFNFHKHFVSIALTPSLPEEQCSLIWSSLNLCSKTLERWQKRLLGGSSASCIGEAGLEERLDSPFASFRRRRSSVLAQFVWVGLSSSLNWGSKRVDTRNTGSWLEAAGSVYRQDYFAGERDVVSEPDPRKNRKEGLGDRLGRKCTLRPECRRASDWFMIACLCAFIGNTNCNR